MNLLTLPLLEAVVLIAKVTVIFCWGVIMISFATRVILSSIVGSIMDELLDPREDKE